MTQFLIDKKDLKEPIYPNPKTRCPFAFNWDMDCIYADINSNCKSDYRGGVDYGGVTVNPGNSDAFCNKLMDFYLSSKVLYEDKF